MPAAPQVLRFGTMRSLVLGLEAVLPDGSAVRGLAALKKDNRGYDLKQLLIGAEGTLGVVTAASLRLVPAIGARAVAWVGLAIAETALALLRHLEPTLGERDRELRAGAESALDLVLAHVPGTRAAARRAAAVERAGRGGRRRGRRRAPGASLGACARALALGLSTTR